MQTTMQRAQEAYDHRLPPDDSDVAELAVNNWLFESAERLASGLDVLFRRRYRKQQGVTYAEFATAVQDHLNQRQKDGEDKEDWFAQLVIDVQRGAPCKTLAGFLLGKSNHSYGKLHEIAEELLKPLAKDGLTAQMEDGEL
ncbi:hypothetical protein QN382_19945 [Pseudomonas sp. 10B1]|uniref:hypothetical protein n=1 Tax=unclassified Pseudomonas TaxID=196821 RepID=UPI002B22303E|nr:MULTISPECIES: hypothetical protein [unclassified Pseudomonas]MEA9994576.1 hypothetical protein [Pseudomonas sp. AA4]MEB0085721.1 hypothetical protein [Pseudomonas sp. RTI1]MEB0125954.1 hypothetical protein [Pseudomonas sp. CCC1.2]MEB0152758.1 hypothetical protein [Pseudomonas sp. CCC4.3]MEB0221263.1 hypothetical protein [Pseudomonas sp. AB12(2023)]